MFNLLENQLSRVIICTISIFLVVGCSSDKNNEDQAKIDSLTEEIESLKKTVAEKEEVSREENKEDNNDPNKEEQSNNEDMSTKNNRNDTDSMSTVKCSLLTESGEGTVFNDPNSFTRMYVDDEGNKYLGNQVYEEDSCYTIDDYYSAPFWEDYIKEYNEAIVNYYNDTDPNMTDPNINEQFRMPTFLKFTGLNGEDSNLPSVFFKNKESGDFANHSATMNVISIDKYNEQDVIITAERTYSHASGSGTVTNEYYINILKNRLIHFKEVE